LFAFDGRSGKKGFRSAPNCARAYTGAPIGRVKGKRRLTGGAQVPRRGYGARETNGPPGGRNERRRPWFAAYHLSAARLPLRLTRDPFSGSPSSQHEAGDAAGEIEACEKGDGGENIEGVGHGREPIHFLN
jgi:hypothetical protein